MVGWMGCCCGGINWGWKPHGRHPRSALGALLGAFRPGKQGRGGRGWDRTTHTPPQHPLNFWHPQMCSEGAGCFEVLLSWLWPCSCLEQQELGAGRSRPKGHRLAPSMGGRSAGSHSHSRAGPFLDPAQVHKLPPLLIYFFLPAFERKAQLHLLSKKGNGFPQVLASCVW